MKRSVFIVTLFLLSGFFLTSCDAINQIIPTITPLPTYTPLSTYTPLPTYTEVPTATLEPTETATETPYVAPTKVPATKIPSTKVPATAVPQQSSGGNTPITWKNETSHVIKIIAKGPATYSLTLQPHEEKMVNWNAGTYSVTYYLDGSSSSAGGESITVVAEEHYLYTLNFR